LAPAIIPSSSTSAASTTCAGERAATLQGVGGEQHGGDARLHVGTAPAVDAPVVHLGPEGIEAPAAGVTFGDDVGVPFEQERRSGSIAFDDGEDVRPAGRDLLDRRCPPEGPHLIGHRLGHGRFAQAPRRIEHARDPHQRSGELHEGVVVEAGGHVGGS
jgi:hypothetical protein